MDLKNYFKSKYSDLYGKGSYELNFHNVEADIVFSVQMWGIVLVGNGFHKNIGIPR